MSIIKFDDLWKNHPHVTKEHALLDVKVYEDQCAINLSAALARAGMNLDGFKGTRSWETGKPKYPIRAQELADWLSTVPKGLPFGPTKFRAKEIHDNLKKESIFQKIPMSMATGIVFFQNYWGPGRQGDHIGLWDTQRLTDISS